MVSTVSSAINYPFGEVMAERKYSRYEKARIVGARALQISMGAPILIEIHVNICDPLRIALYEFDNDAIPMTVKRIKDGTIRGNE